MQIDFFFFFQNMQDATLTCSQLPRLSLIDAIQLPSQLCFLLLTKLSFISTIIETLSPAFCIAIGFMQLPIISVVHSQVLELAAYKYNTPSALPNRTQAYPVLLPKTIFQNNPFLAYTKSEGRDKQLKWKQIVVFLELPSNCCLSVWNNSPALPQLYYCQLATSQVNLIINHFQYFVKQVKLGCYFYEPNS